MTKATRLGLILASAHFLVYATSAYFTDAGWPSATLILYWLVIDFPVGFVTFAFGMGYAHWVDQVFGNDSVYAELLWAPNIVFGILGSLWWFMIPRFVMSKSSGGFRP